MPTPTLAAPPSPAATGVCTALAMLCCAAQFPVPDAESEFRGAVEWAAPTATAIRGDFDKFSQYTQPFAPLSLSVERSRYAEANALRNFYFGFMGGMAGMRPAMVQKLISGFQCGEACASQRLYEVRRRMKVLRDVVQRFRALQGVNIISQWNVNKEYRVNHVFQWASGRTEELTPSPTFGLVPSTTTRPWKSMDAYLQSIQVNPHAVHRLASDLAKQQWSAIVRTDMAVKVVLTGVSDNEAGVIFYDLMRPATGDQTDDGLKYQGVVDLAQQVAYYQST